MGVPLSIGAVEGRWSYLVQCLESGSVLVSNIVLASLKLQCTVYGTRPFLFSCSSSMGLWDRLHLVRDLDQPRVPMSITAD